MLDTPWQDLDATLQQIWLWGTGDTAHHLYLAARLGQLQVWRRIRGVIPELVAKYTGTKSKPQLRQLERFMRVLRCPDCHG